MQRTVPILHIDSYEEAKAYYVDWLGFKIDWEFRFEPTFPVYMQVSRDGLVLHLSEHKGGNSGPAMCHVEVDDLDALMSNRSLSVLLLLQRKQRTCTYPRATRTCFGLNSG
jgi:catechol 2,3-dioxygenase-like lactoylglutathione lyase family enzyme